MPVNGVNGTRYPRWHRENRLTKSNETRAEVAAYLLDDVEHCACTTGRFTFRNQYGWERNRNSPDRTKGPRLGFCKSELNGSRCFFVFAA
jgi:hypothetical protein